MNKQYECIAELALDRYDSDGFYMHGEQILVLAGSVWTVEEGEHHKIIGGEVRLVNEELDWMELPIDTLEKHFRLITHEGDSSC